MEHHQDTFLCTFLNVPGEQESLHPYMHVHFENEVQCMRDFRSSQLGKVYDFLSFQRGKMYDFISSQPGKVHEFICSDRGKSYDFISSQPGKVYEFIFSQRKTVYIFKCYWQTNIFASLYACAFSKRGPVYA